MSNLDLPSDEELHDWSRQRTAELEKSVARQTEEIHELRQANYDLRVELARIIYQYIDDHAPRADDARIDRALLDLAQPNEWQPLQTKIAFGFGHESIVCDATSIGGLPLPDDVMIMQRTPAQPTTNDAEHIGTVDWTGPSGRTWKVDLEIDESEE